MEIQLKENSTTPLYKQARDTIRSQILSGQLPDGFKLLSERQSVEKLGVRRNTVKKAYGIPIHEGLVCAPVKAPREYFVRSGSSETKPDGKPDTRKAFSSLDKNFNCHFLGTQDTF